MRPLIDHAKRDRELRIARETLTPRQLAVHLEGKGFSRADACRIAKFDEHAEYRKAARAFLLVLAVAAVIAGAILKFSPAEAESPVVTAAPGSTLLLIFEHVANKRTGFSETLYATPKRCEDAKRNIKTRNYRTWRFCK